MMRAYLRMRMNEERGATIVIVVLTLIALFGMIVLVVDVGGVLLKRRELVAGSDAAALAVAQTCAVPADQDPNSGDLESLADTYATQNVPGLEPTVTTNIIDISNCHGDDSTENAAGFVTVNYGDDQKLFFAPVLGASTQQSVHTEATAAWGPLAGGNAVPIVLESSQFQGPCEVPDVEIGETCPFWYNNGNAAIGDANWGFLNLDQWGVDPDDNCNSSGGAADRTDYILHNFSDHPLVLDDPGPTYVCSMTGHATSNWQDLIDRMDGNYSNWPGAEILMPVNDCGQQIDKNGNIVACGTGTPDKFAIIGFTKLKLVAIYQGNDPQAIGTPGLSAQTGQCNDVNVGTTTVSGEGGLGGWYLPDFATANCGATRTPDTITNVLVKPPKNNDPALVPCTSPSPATPANCDYYYNPSTKILSWMRFASKKVDNRLSFNWSVPATAGTSGACGLRSPDPNALCLVMEWKGFSDNVGVPGSGHGFGAFAVALCDFRYDTCPETP